MPRGVYLVGVGLALVALAFASMQAALESRTPGATWANAQRIRPGMSRGEVERILGGPGEVEGSELDGLWSARVYAWLGPEGTAYVILGYRRATPGAEEGGGVVRRAFFSPRSAGTCFLARLRAWLGW
jgi:hypothetical protein